MDYITLEKIYDYITIKKNNERLLFQEIHISSEVLVKNEEIRNMYFEDFCEDVVYYYDDKLKDKIYSNLFEMFKKWGKIVSNNKSLINILKGKNKILSNEQYNKVKNLIVTMLNEYNFDKSRLNFIKKREFCGTDWHIEEGKKERIQGYSAIWFEIQSKKEFIDFVMEETSFQAILIDNNIESIIKCFYCDIYSDDEILTIYNNDEK